MLEARRIDGAQQFFTRAFDFGSSRTADETFKQWPHDVLLADIVTVVRAFRATTTDTEALQRMGFASARASLNARLVALALEATRPRD